MYIYINVQGLNKPGIGKVEVHEQHEPIWAEANLSEVNISGNNEYDMRQVCLTRKLTDYR